MLRNATETLEQIDFRMASETDAAGLVTIDEIMFAETDRSGHGLKFDPDRALRWVQNSIAGGNRVFIVAVDKATDSIIGSLDYTLAHNYTDRPVAEMGRFYVLPIWRLSAVGLILLTCAINTARSDGAAAFHAFLNSGIASGASNLFRRLGFRETPHAALFGKEL